MQPNWDAKRITVMERLIRDKFNEHFPLKLKLINLENVKLVQGKSDTFWGVDESGNGENHVGELLMKVRDDIIRNEGTFKEQVAAFLKNHQIGFLMDMITFENE
jgi:predicted NAD-dependent protein-ADP-ribosyltransferase YbiA (DUF1768 family)